MTKQVTLKFSSEGAQKTQAEADSVATKLAKVSSAASKMNKQLDVTSIAYKKLQSMVRSSVRSGARAVQTGQVIDIFTSGNIQDQLLSGAASYISAYAVGTAQNIGDRLAVEATKTLAPSLARTVVRALGGVVGGFVGIAAATVVTEIVPGLVSKLWEKLTTGSITNAKYSQEQDFKKRGQDSVESFLLYGPMSQRLFSPQDMGRQMEEGRIARGKTGYLDFIQAYERVKDQRDFYYSENGVPSQVVNPRIGVGGNYVGAGQDELADAVINLDRSVRALLQQRMPVSNF